jgi:hypothetical protein
MRWLTRDQLQELYRHSPVPTQAISLASDVAALCNDIPVPPEAVGPSDGPASPLNRWYGSIDRRPLVVDAEVTPQPGQTSVLIHTPYAVEQIRSDDWAVLLELRALPKSIFVSRPLFIESRNEPPICVVYRPDPQGWNSALYKAASQEDADRLLKFLRTDDWNESCFVGKQVPGKWVSCQGQQVIYGIGSELNVALQFACYWSLRYAPATILVKDISGASSVVYAVSQGRVLGESPAGTTECA